MLLKYNLPTLLWAAIISVLTLMPAAKMPKVPAWELVSFATASHAGVFFILGLLMRRGFYRQQTSLTLRRHSGWYTFFLSVMFGGLIELLQGTLGWGRQAEVLDMVSNSIGTLTAILAFNLALRYRLITNIF